jgi:hypothetical protein
MPVGDLIGGIFGGDEMSDAYGKAMELQKQIYEQTMANLTPWMTSGQGALKELYARVMAGPGDFKASPGYQARLSEGLKALGYQNAAAGRMGSGARDRAVTRFAQDYASNEYQNFLNQYQQGLQPFFQLSNTGLSAANSMGQFGQNYANAMSGLYTGQGKAKASQWDAFGGFLDGVIGTGVGLYDLMGKAPAPTGMGQPSQGFSDSMDMWNRNGLTSQDIA